MGGRGSGGSRSGGGASANPPRLVSPSQYYQEKYRDLTDKELNRALINSRNLMNKENAKVMSIVDKSLSKAILSNLEEDFIARN